MAPPKTGPMAIAALAAGLAAGCSLPPLEAQHLDIASNSPRFIDEVDNGTPAPSAMVDGYALWPDPALFPPPWPAMVILHTSNGQGTQDWDYAARLRDMGVAALAVDSFSGRGVDKTVDDLTAVSTSSMLVDAYAALGRLAADSRVDPGRIGVLGFSKGGVAALYAAFERYRATQAVQAGQRFALHVAYYPWCGVSLLDLRTTGAPVMIHMGARDSVSPPPLCETLTRSVQASDPTADITLHIHQNARHAFDHPMLAWFSSLPTSGVAPTSCRIVETAPGSFEERHSGRQVNGDNLAEVLDACSSEGALVGSNEIAAADAWAISLDAIQRYLMP